MCIGNRYCSLSVLCAVIFFHRVAQTQDCASEFDAFRVLRTMGHSYHGITGQSSTRTPPKAGGREYTHLDRAVFRRN